MTTSSLPLPVLVQRAPPPVSSVATLPDTGTWLAAGREGFGGRGLLFVGSLETGRADIYEGYEWLRGLHGLDAATALFTNGQTVVRVRLPTLEILERIELPPVPDPWGEQFSGEGERTALCAGARLSVLGAEHNSVIAELGAGESFPAPDAFTAVVMLPGATRLVVGRGDGRLEVRDARTLDVVAVHQPMVRDACCLCALSDDTVAVSDGTRTTGLLSLGTGVFRPLDHDDTTTGLHRLADGRLAVVAPRRILVYAGETRQLDADFTPALQAAECFRRSALSGDTLLLACGTRGLLSVSVSQLPEVRPPDDAERRGAELLRQLTEALTAKAEVDVLVGELTRLEQPKLHLETFEALAQHGVPLRDIRVHLASPLPTVRAQVLRHVVRFPSHFASAAVDVKPLLEDVNSDVRLRAVVALQSLGDPAAIEWLRPLLQDPDWLTVDLVEQALKALLARTDGEAR